MEAKKLRELLKYDPLTGNFFWRHSRSGVKDLTKPAGSYLQQGYRRIGIEGSAYKAHRLAFLYMEGRVPATVDHIDGDKSNNRWSNLREASVVQNGANMKLPTNNTSGYKGVHWSKVEQAWQVRLQAEGVRHHLGYFTCKHRAAIAYNRAAICYQKDYARLNHIQRREHACQS
ncbi:HNH endonuclease [bacterium]|nr:HNH endonuclease [bacterium]